MELLQEQELIWWKDIKKRINSVKVGMLKRLGNPFIRLHYLVSKYHLHLALQ